MFQLSATRSVDGGWIVLNATFPRKKHYLLLKYPTNNIPRYDKDHDDIIFPLDFISQVEKCLLDFQEGSTSKRKFKSTKIRFAFFHQIAITGIFFVINLYRKLLKEDETFEIQFCEYTRNGDMFSPFGFKDPIKDATTRRIPLKEMRTDRCSMAFIESLPMECPMKVKLMQCFLDGQTMEHTYPSLGANDDEKEQESFEIMEREFQGRKSPVCILEMSKDRFPSRENVEKYTRYIHSPQAKDFLKRYSFTYRTLETPFCIVRYIAWLFLIMQTMHDSPDKSLVFIYPRVQPRGYTPNTPLILSDSISRQCTLNAQYLADESNYFDSYIGAKINCLAITAVSLDRLWKQTTLKELKYLFVIDQGFAEASLYGVTACLSRFPMLHLIYYKSERAYRADREDAIMRERDFRREAGLSETYVCTFEPEREEVAALLGYTQVSYIVNGVNTHATNLPEHPNVKHCLLLLKYFDAPFSRYYFYREWAKHVARIFASIGSGGESVLNSSSSEKKPLRELLYAQTLNEIEKILPFGTPTNPTIFPLAERHVNVNLMERYELIRRIKSQTYLNPEYEDSLYKEIKKSVGLELRRFIVDNKLIIRKDMVNYHYLVGLQGKGSASDINIPEQFVNYNEDLINEDEIQDDDDENMKRGDALFDLIFHSNDFLTKASTRVGQFEGSLVNIQTYGTRDQAARLMMQLLLNDFREKINLDWIQNDLFKQFDLLKRAIVLTLRYRKYRATLNERFMELSRYFCGRLSL